MATSTEYDIYRSEARLIAFVPDYHLVQYLRDQSIFLSTGSFMPSHEWYWSASRWAQDGYSVVQILMKLDHMKGPRNDD